ncbi:MAG: hypothetical protein WC091_26395 [Sulfuricellaceae bacterium]
MERCPACRARLGDTSLCPRCGCDFTLAVRAENQARSLACQAVQAWCAGEHDRAAHHADASLALKRSRLAGTLAAMLRDDYCKPDEPEPITD